MNLVCHFVRCVGVLGLCVLLNTEYLNNLTMRIFLDEVEESEAL